MTPREQLLQEIEQAPEPLVEEILDFLLFTKSRRERELSSSVENREAEAKSIWEVADDITADLPEEAINELPTDGAAQHDYYLYGVPKRES